MKNIICTALILLLFPLGLFAQFEIFRSGNWTDVNPGTTPWLGGVPASTVSDMVTMDDGFNVTVAGSDNIVSGSVTTGNTNTLTVQPFGLLQLGDGSNSRDMTAGTSMTITVQNNGEIIIWGNLVVNNSLIIAIQGPNGKIIIKGNVTLADNASLTVNGNLEVDGSFTGGMNTNVTVGAGGSIGVSGLTSVGAGSNVIGSGHFNTYGGCSGPASFCNSLPLELMFFTAESMLSSVKLSWATASELNFDKFIIEKSSDAKTFTTLAEVSGHGTSITRNDYAFEDEKPSLGRSYYRLTEVDLDNVVRPLKMVEVNFTGSKALSVFPNPVTDGRLTFELNFVPEGEVFISIVDLRGVTLSQFKISQPSITLPIELSSGIYVVTMRTDDFKAVSRLVVR